MTDSKTATKRQLRAETVKRLNRTAFKPADLWDALIPQWCFMDIDHMCKALIYLLTDDDNGIEDGDGHMTDSKTATELLDGLRDVGNLHEFAELFGFDWYDENDWTWHDVAVKMADDFEQAIAATRGSGECENIAKYWGEFECSECDTLADFGSDLHLVSYCPHCGKAVKR